MVICRDCGAVIGEDDLVVTKSYVSDYMGGCYESITSCPCGGSVEDAEKCDSCGEYFKKDELHSGICEECLHEEMTVDNAIACGADESAREEVSLNGFLVRLFTSEKIDEILIREVERLISESDSSAVYIINQAEEWCNEDLSFFADWLRERQK